MASLLDYFLDSGLQKPSDPGDPSMPYGPPLWPVPRRPTADTGGDGPVRFELRRESSQVPLWPQPEPDLSWTANSTGPFEFVADHVATAPGAAPQATTRLPVSADIPLSAQQQNGNGAVSPMPLQPLWPPPPWPEPQIDTWWFDHGPLASDANTVAAWRQVQKVRPRGGRKEGPLTSLPEELLIPKTPLDWAMYATGGPLSPMRLGAKALMLGLGAALQPTDAQAGLAGKLLGAFGVSRFPGRYKDARQIAQEAAALAVREGPEMKRLFRVDRDDLFEMSKRIGNQDPVVSFPPGSRGSEHAEMVTNQENANRLIAPMSEMQKQYPDVSRGMMAWFVMDPAYQRLVELVGKEEGGRRFDQLNIFSGLASPGSSVPLELNRGLGAYYLNQQNRFDDFVKHGGVAQGNRGADFPRDMTGIAGHVFHGTAHLKPMQRYVDTGRLDMDSVKVPLYIQSSGVPERGFQTQLPVADVHFSRGIGLTDARPNPARSTTRAELQTISPWHQERVASPLGLTPVQAEGLQWGTFGPQTGVRTPLGATKLEIMAKSIVDTARRLGMNPEQLRDMILLGERYPAYGKVPMTPEMFTGR